MGCFSSKHVKIHTQLTSEEITLLKDKTKFTEKDSRMAHCKWHSLNTRFGFIFVSFSFFLGFLRDCPNGKLGKKQLDNVYKLFYPQGNVRPFCKYIFAAVDTNRDGKIDFMEYLMQIASLSQNNLNDRLAIAFDIYDISGDGQIDQKELAALISALYDLVGEPDRKGDRDPKKRAANIIAKLDVNGDRKLNKEEFILGCQSDSVLRRILAPTDQPIFG